MIVKIWPVRGTKGVKSTLLYVQDENKVLQIEKNEDGKIKRKTVIDTQATAGIDAQQYFIENETNLTRVMEYIADEDKIRSKYISGYLCDPEKADDDFDCMRHITCAHAGAKVRDGTGDIVAFHVVQSFPEGLDIDDEEVHQCGIELVERLAKHQAVIASHVHPVINEQGEVHGKCKHNHIVFNAYIHPEKIDPERPGLLRYDSSQHDYRMLQFWNDEIAIEHGLPIIRNPDLKRKYSWYESEMQNKMTSWKGRIRLDINDARRVTSSWEEFAAIMERDGYKVRERGNTVTFIAPDGHHKVRGATLGRPYSKEGLERYWAIRDQTRREISADIKLNRDIHIGDLLKAKQDLSVAIPIGNEGLEHIQYTYLPLMRSDLTAKALGTYFRKKSMYDICDANGNILASVSGAELIDHYHLLHEGRETPEKAPENPVETTEDWKKTDEYYYNEQFRNSQTNEHYRVPKRDSNGNFYSLLHLIFKLACVVLKKEEGKWTTKNVPQEKKKEPIYGKTDWKLQSMMDALAIAREEGIHTPAEIEEKLQIAGATYSRVRASLKRTQAAKESMDSLAETVRRYRETVGIAEEIFAMPLGEERKQAELEFAADLAAYKNAKASMYRNGISTEDKVLEFETRYASVESNLEDLQERFDGAKEQYSRLKKLQYHARLAQNTQYVYGPSYDAKTLNEDPYRTELRKG